MRNLKIKKADITDLEIVANMFDLYRQFYDQTHDLSGATRFIRARIENSESIIFIALENEDDPVGFCQLYPSFCSVIAQPILVLYDLYVVESKRKVGAGRSLLLECENYAKSIGVKRLDLTTAKDNFAAQSLYESLGWERDNVFFAYNRSL